MFLIKFGAATPNSTGPTYLSGSVLSNTTWTLSGSPYIVTDSITVVSGVTLTIEPGVIVKFDSDFSLIINGTLNAQGTSASPITFTSNAASPAPGDWKGIYFNNYVDDATTFLEHCVVEYGGDTYNSNIYCYNCPITY